tara:strand:+ start:1331 stop:2155 length:825 start_codon:yes stop_codon:yes gene_type:complete
LKKKNCQKVKGKTVHKKKSRLGSRAVWDQSAQWYDALVGDRGSDYQKEVVLPGAWRLLDLKKGYSALDIGCGQGVFSRYLDERGVKVEGIDVSSELVGFARKRSPGRIHYHVTDVADFKVLPKKTFNGVACLLAVQNISDIESVFKNAARWLKPRGRFVFVATHPCFRIPRQSHWGWDEEKKTQFRRVDHYATAIDIPILTPPMADSKIFTKTHHRSLQDYFLALAKAGLCVDALEEWTSHKSSRPGKRSRAENRARKEIPLFLAVRARRVLKV